MIEKFIIKLDSILQLIFPNIIKDIQYNYNPSDYIKDTVMDNKDRNHVIGLIRVNHSGEVCAQALYKAQYLLSKQNNIKEYVKKTIIEELHHLIWCKIRLEELYGKSSILDPIWYIGSFIIGMTFGLFGESIGLSFISETERQVGIHLQACIQSLPTIDKKTIKIFKTIQKDEIYHSMMYKNYGKINMCFFVKKIMYLLSKIMIYTSYYI